MNTLDRRYRVENNALLAIKPIMFLTVCSATSVKNIHEALRKVPANETASVKLFGYSKVTASGWKIGACTELNRKK